jgi:hypothetical protein
LLVAPDFPVQILALEMAGSQERYSAAYWLQSASQTTDDYATRIWADLAPDKQPWVLVTILFDKGKAPQTAEAQGLYLALKDVVQEHLAGGNTQ